MKSLDDLTPFDGDEVDTAARAAWLVRASRLAREEPPSRRALAERIAATGVRCTEYDLGDLEAGRRRNGTLLEAVERGLDLAPGALCSPVETLYRSFAGSPPDKAPPPPVTDAVAAYEVVDAVERGGHPTASQWWRWSRLMGSPYALGASRGTLRRLLLQLASEMSRASGTAYVTRYEALVAVRRGPHADLLLEVATAMVDDPHVQLLYDLVSAVCEVASRDAWRWAARLLTDERPHVVHGAALGIENMVGLAGFEAGWWADVQRPLAAAFTEAQPQGEVWRSLSKVVRLMPDDAAHAVVREHVPERLAPVPQPPSWERSRSNRWWSTCQTLALAMVEERGASDPELVARLLFDLALSPSEAKSVTSGMLLMTSPLAHDTSEALTRIADEAGRGGPGVADGALRGQVVRRLAAMQAGHVPSGLLRWRAAPGAHVAQRVLCDAVLAYGGHQVPGADLEEYVDRPGFLRRRGLLVAGLTSSPLLEKWVDHDEADLAGGAGWWLEHGGVVADGPDRCADCPAPA